MQLSPKTKVCSYIMPICGRVPFLDSRHGGSVHGERENLTRLVLGARAVRIPDKSSKTDGTGSSLPDLDKKTVTLRSLD